MNLMAERSGNCELYFYSLKWMLPYLCEQVTIITRGQFIGLLQEFQVWSS